MTKTITISDDCWNKLSIIKLKGDFKTMNDVIIKLLKGGE